jgi:hypothetical protein
VLAAAAAAVRCSQRNLLGLNQKLSALVELGQSDSLFRLQWVDPWIRGDPNRTSMTVSMMNTRWERGLGPCLEVAIMALLCHMRYMSSLWYYRWSGTVSHKLPGDYRLHSYCCLGSLATTCLYTLTLLQ